VFAREDGAPIHPNRMTDAFGRQVKASGLSKIRLHDLRHTHATLALTSGIPVHVVSARLGHANASITRNVYAHLLPTSDEEAAERVAVLVGATVATEEVGSA
jgi:integrase